MNAQMQDVPSPWLTSPVKSSPNPSDNVLIYKAQSLLTMNGELGPVLEVDQARDVIEWAKQGGPVK